MQPTVPLAPHRPRAATDPTAPAARLTGRAFAAVLFDMDGTLVDSTASVVRCWLRLADEYGVTVEALQAAAGHGRPARDIVADLLPETDHVAGLARITELEVADVEGVVALPGAHDALARTAGRSAIVTSCTGPLALARQRAAGVVVPDVVVTADDVRHGKPHPEPFLTGAARLGVDPSRCLVVEDAPAGLAAARAAGMATLAVTTTHEADELHADLVVPDLSYVTWLDAEDGVVPGVRPSA
ncbi:HAD-IA family hydrolase [Aquipuribacter nitratireducens]|uniref:HAD-IA family hydrolase n=1 Tax=Aquipuribacter nitratireducens TaxID=650104 RepID=A0ABW0GL66_9MICO